MKLVLSILLFIFAPVLTEQGLQIGEININNQKIKIMKMNLNNPAFLQMAGNMTTREYISIVCATENPKLFNLSANGEVRIVSISGGVETVQLIESPSAASVVLNSDANTQILLYGTITTFSNALYSEVTQLTSIDITHAKSLKGLYINGTQLTSLDVSKNIALTSLRCDNNQLTSLDVSKNIALTSLSCGTNQLTSLDVSKNIALTTLSCDRNQLTSLDVSKNIALTSLSCAENPIITLDIINNVLLTYISLRAINTILNVRACAVNEDVTGDIVYVINLSDATDGTVTLRNGDEYNSTISDAATTKGWTVEYVDAA